MTSDKERRKYKRYRLKVSVWLEEAETHGLEKTVSENVSAGGLMFKTRDQLEVGGQYTLYLQFPFFLDLVTATARVIHSEKVASSDHWLVGIELIDVTGITREQLIVFLHGLEEEIMLSSKSDN